MNKREFKQDVKKLFNKIKDFFKSKNFKRLLVFGLALLYIILLLNKLCGKDNTCKASAMTVDNVLVYHNSAYQTVSLQSLYETDETFQYIDFDINIGDLLFLAQDNLPVYVAGYSVLDMLPAKLVFCGGALYGVMIPHDVKYINNNFDHYRYVDFDQYRYYPLPTKGINHPEILITISTSLLVVDDRIENIEEHSYSRWWCTFDLILNDLVITDSGVTSRNIQYTYDGLNYIDSTVYDFSLPINTICYDKDYQEFLTYTDTYFCCVPYGATPSVNDLVNYSPLYVRFFYRTNIIQFYNYQNVMVDSFSANLYDCWGTIDNISFGDKRVRSLYVQIGTEYDIGYSAGYDEGYDIGYNEGVEGGTVTGYQNGYNSGYDKGYEDGLLDNDAIQEASKIAFDAGYSDGYNAGIYVGETNGNSIGYQNGYTIGYDEGIKSQRAYREGIELGWRNGYDEGYASGLIADDSIKDGQYNWFKGLTKSVDGLLNTPFIGDSVSLSTLITVAIGCFLLIALIKTFLGG